MAVAGDLSDLNGLRLRFKGVLEFNELNDYSAAHDDEHNWVEATKPRFERLSPSSDKNCSQRIPHLTRGVHSDKLKGCGQGTAGIDTSRFLQTEAMGEVNCIRRGCIPIAQEEAQARSYRIALPVHWTGVRMNASLRGGNNPDRLPSGRGRFH